MRKREREREIGDSSSSSSSSGGGGGGDGSSINAPLPPRRTSATRQPGTVPAPCPSPCCLLSLPVLSLSLAPPPWPSSANSIGQQQSMKSTCTILNLTRNRVFFPLRRPDGIKVKVKKHLLLTLCTCSYFAFSSSFLGKTGQGSFSSLLFLLVRISQILRYTLLTRTRKNGQILRSRYVIYYCPVQRP